MFKKLRTALVAVTLMTSLSLPPTLAMAAPVEVAEAVKTGQVVERTLADGSKAHYFLYVPRSAGSHPPLFVTVHGISRNAREHATLFAPFAEKYGVVVLAPLFPEPAYHDYQRLVHREESERADQVLDDLIDDAGRLTGAQTDHFYLFGYSGGGQFTHRYAMLHPERIKAYAVGAAGWYTFPDARRSYPRGIKPGKFMPAGLQMQPQRFLAIPATVLVGERDVHPGTALRKTSKVNSQQGSSRFERGRHWVEAMRQAAKDQGVAGSFDFVAIPKCAHSFRRCMQRGNMGEAVFDHLFGPQGAPQQADRVSKS